MFANSGNAQDKPNIVLIYADDLGIDAISCFNKEIGNFKTPNIDAMAARAVSFTDAHSTASCCSPSRYGLLTGRYQWRSHKKSKIVGRREKSWIAQERETLPEMLKRGGYKTAMLGKWHLGWDSEGNKDYSGELLGGPCDHGFDYYFGNDVPGWAPYTWTENRRFLKKPDTTIKKTPRGASPGAAVSGWDFTAVLPEYVKRCEKYIKENSKGDTPYFLCFTMPSPHSPISPSKAFQGKAATPFLDFLLESDAAVGRIIKAVEASVDKDNTIIIFTSDNGTTQFADYGELLKKGYNLGARYRGLKSSIYEGGNRMPFIVHYPGITKRGVRLPQTITQCDIFATLAEVAKVTYSDDTAEDSLSFLSLLKGEKDTAFEKRNIVNQDPYGKLAIRQGNWKLIFTSAAGTLRKGDQPNDPEDRKSDKAPWRLFDLDKDPGEKNNLYSKHPEVVKEMHKAMKKLVRDGRSTPGKKVSNEGDWWEQLPWDENEK